jgi:hypothetical protein
MPNIGLKPYLPCCHCNLTPALSLGNESYPNIPECSKAINGTDCSQNRLYNKQTILYPKLVTLFISIGNNHLPNKKEVKWIYLQFFSGFIYNFLKKVVVMVVLMMYVRLQGIKSPRLYLMF